jgi:hypothetical protein
MRVFNGDSIRLSPSSLAVFTCARGSLLLMHLIQRPICPFQRRKEIITGVFPLLVHNYVTNLDVVRNKIYTAFYWHLALLFIHFMTYLIHYLEKQQQLQHASVDKNITLI